MAVLQLGSYRRESVEQMQTPDFEAESFVGINFDELAAHAGGPLHVIADLDHTLRIPSGNVDSSVTEHISAARVAGSILSFSIATDNVFGHYAPGASEVSDKIYRPFIHDKVFVHKPHPAFYCRIVDDIQAPPSSILMIGNDPYNDIFGAKLVGITTMQVPSIGSSIPTEFLRRHKEHRGRRILAAGKVALSKHR